MNPAVTRDSLLAQILDTVHPMMAEGLFLAAIPEWYDTPLMAALRSRADGKDAGLVERLMRYSFIVPLQESPDETPAYAVRPEERHFLQQRWIAQDPAAYRAAHARALAYWEAHPAENPYAQAQNLVYHRLFVNLPDGVDAIIALFRQYRGDRQLAAIERLLATAVSARAYLALLGEDLVELDDLLAHLNALLAQLRGRWEASRQALEALRHKPALSPRLQPYVARAYGHALAHAGQFVEAMAEYRAALALFDRHAAAARGDDDVEAEKAHTLIALGDAHVGLAVAARGFDAKTTAQTSLHDWVSSAFHAFLSLPLLIYLGVTIGPRVLHPHFWPALRDLDWLIARLFALGARYYRTADPILESHGTPAEGIAADERLGNLYLALGDVRRARTLFTTLLDQPDNAPRNTEYGIRNTDHGSRITDYAPPALTPYRQSVIALGLAEAELRANQPDAARSRLQTAVPTLLAYEDDRLLAQAAALEAAACAVADPAAAVAAHEDAIRQLQAAGSVTAATSVAERLAALAADPRLPAERQAAAADIAAALPRRRYPTRYRHPITVQFQRLVVFLLAVALFLMPISSYRLETGSSVAPEISFNASPLLQSDNPNFIPTLSQGVSALRLAPAPNPDVLIGIALAIFVGYLLLSTAAGLLVILRTPLAQVQAAGRATAVHLDGDTLAVGLGADRQSLPLADAAEFLRANVRVYQELLIDNAVAQLRAPGRPPLRITGHTAWYEPLLRRIDGRIPPTARRVDLGYKLIRSRMGLLYGLTLGLLFLLALLGRFAPASVQRDLLGTPYSLADLYPYIYLGLFIPSLWWFVLRPLQINWHTAPRSRLLWAAAAAALLLALLRLLTRFRPWLTVPDIYPSLLIAILAIAAAVAAWRTRPVVDNGAPARAPAWRAGLALLAVALSLLMGAHLWREVRAYHFLVVGNAWRDQAIPLPDSPEKADLAARARTAYSRAMTIAQTPILGITGRGALAVPVGIPRPIQNTWLAALNGRAAMSSQLGDYATAVADYSTILSFTRSPEIHVSRGIALLGLGSQPGDALGEMDVERDLFAEAIADFDRAVAGAPETAVYLLWRGVANHGLGRLAAAGDDYAAALAITGDGALALAGVAQAHTGRGWIAFSAAAYETAVAEFDAAAVAARQLDDRADDVRIVANQPAADALLGLGYAYYALREYDAALAAWDEAAEYNQTLDRPNPAVPISLGTLYWRVATLGDDYNAFGTDRCQSTSLPDAEKTVEAEALERSLAAFDTSLTMPGQTDADRAFTYRTRGQVTYLLRDCPGYDRVAVLESAHGEYVDAVTLAPDNPGYWYRKGRLAHAVWDASPAGARPNEWLETAVTDIGSAAELAPTTEVYWYDQAWMAYTLWANLPAGTGISAREWLFVGLDAIEEAAAINPSANNETWRVRIAAEAIDGTLARGDDFFAAADYTRARDYYGLVATEDEGNAAAALKTGLAAVALDDRAAAETWFAAAADRATAAGDAATANLANALLALNSQGASLERLVTAAANLETTPVITPDDDAPDDDEPDAADLFAQGLDAVTDGRYVAAAAAYHAALETAAAAADRGAALAAGRALRDYLIANPKASLPDLYWPLVEATREKETAVAQLPAPDLFWRYRAEFSFQIIGRLFAVTPPGNERLYDAIFDVIIADIERAYAIDPDAHQVWRDFFVDANTGWLYLQRANELVAREGDWQQALADYTTAIRRIQPNSDNARGDLIDAYFNGGRLALRLGDAALAEQWTATGVAYANRYDLPAKISAARAALDALLAAEPALARSAAPLLSLLAEDS